MVDKVQLIKEEIKRRIESINSCPFRTAELGSEKIEKGELSAYNSILQFIDSIPEKSASEDLEEEIDRFAKTVVPSRSKTITRKNLSLCAKHFAHWQHGKDFDDLLQSEMKFPKEYYAKGKADATKEIMKDAVEGTVVGRDRSTMPPFQTKCKIVVDRVSIDAKEDDKVKVIIVKNE